MRDSSMAGKTCVITGPTQGIGRATAHGLAERGARLLLLCRNVEKGRALAAELKGEGGVEVIETDLARLQSVAQAAAQVLELAPRIDVLINNAGTVNNQRRETVDGLEEMFAVNYLAHFLLTTRLLPALSAPARVVHVGSGAHAMVRGFDFDDYNWQRRRYRTFPAYGHSKLANLLFNRALAKRLAGSGVTSNTLHPGAVATGMGSNNGTLGKVAMLLLKPFFLTPEQGAQTSVYLATDPAASAFNGEYFIKCKPARPRPWAEDDAAAERLWSLSETLLRERQLFG